METFTLEIAATSLEDVRRAKEAGADRVELGCALELGGLTPTPGTVRLAKRYGLPIMAMLRPRTGGFCFTDEEFATMLEDVKDLLAAGADGIVCGILHADGTVDVERGKRIREAIGDHVAVFHRAFDVVPDWQAAMDDIIAMGYTRILTSGTAASVVEGAATVRKMRDYAAGRIEILPGAGVRVENAREILRITGANCLHASLGELCYDHSCEGNPAIHFNGSAAENAYKHTHIEKVKALLAAVRG